MSTKADGVTPNDPPSPEAYVRVEFRLEADEDGWPPYDAETCWARRTEDPELVVIDNVLFFVREVSCGDVVRVGPADGTLRPFVEVVARGGHRTLRVIVHEADATPHRDAVRALGCAVEGSSLAGLFAIDVPPQVELATVFALLAGWEAEGVAEYEVGDAEEGREVER